MKKNELVLVEKLLGNIKELSTLKNYDNEKFLYSTIHLTSQLLYFYRDIAKERPSDSIHYNLKRNIKTHTLVYVNLGRGFPKELMDGHWCYVLKDFGVKLLVIPTTSIKSNSHFNKDFDMDIISKDNNNDEVLSRLCISEMKCVDKQRIDLRKSFRRVLTEKEKIKEFVINKVLD